MGFAAASIAEFPAWKQAYMTALFEVDKQKLRERIEQAESAVVLRARELFTDSGSHQQERRALEAALCALRALRSITHDQTAPPTERRTLAI